jgi:hypothetical protein
VRFLGAAQRILLPFFGGGGGAFGALVGKLSFSTVGFVQQRLLPPDHLLLRFVLGSTHPAPPFSEPVPGFVEESSGGSDFTAVFTHHQALCSSSSSPLLLFPLFHLAPGFRQKFIIIATLIIIIAVRGTDFGLHFDARATRGHVRGQNYFLRLR